MNTRTQNNFRKQKSAMSNKKYAYNGPFDLNDRMIDSYIEKGRREYHTAWQQYLYEFEHEPLFFNSKYK